MRQNRQILRYSSIARTMATALCLSFSIAHSSQVADDDPASAIELLTAYAGDSAERYEPFFRYSEQARIVGIEIHAVGNETTTARYSGREEAWKEVHNILRITTADGFEGVSGVDTYYQGEYSDTHLRELRGIAADLVALRSLDPVEVGAALRQRRPALSDEARASIDIALWDLAARKAGRPLFEMLGAKRESMEPYASLPFYDSLPEYVEAVNEYAALGYTVFKFHVWGRVEDDVQLVALIQETFAGAPYRFMIDLEGAYELKDAMTLAEQMDRGLFVLLEGPVDDALLDQYAELRRRFAIDIIPAGYSIYSPEFMRRAIEVGAWDAGRFDATVIGGISKALELLIIANDAGLPIDIQSWGHSLAQVSNLHLMLANERTRYFEAPMPGKAFEFGTQNGNLLEKGRVAAPDEPGLGIRMDWDSLAAADFHVHFEPDASRPPE